ncbi:hypothetical protein ACL02U_22780 [Streptomyces sp. MS06]|uniref:hypothetical protein n=1 Tax=Streptomyces sp. MS06 TaxID=3385974 RepID=UPI0039A24F9F
MITLTDAPAGRLFPTPDKSPAALRVAVARLSAEALPRFDTHRAEAMNQARDAFSLLSGRHSSIR